MRRQVLLALPAAAAMLLPAYVTGPGDRGPSAQQFSQVLATADKEFSRKDYIASAKALQQGILIANTMLRNAILSAMPMRPRGFGVVSMPEPQVDPRDPILAAVALNPDRPIEQRYRRDGAAGEIRVLVLPNSPAAGAAANRIALVQEHPDSELVETGKRVGVLTSRRGSFQLQFLLGKDHLVEARAYGVEPEVVTAMIDAAFLDRVAQILGE